MPAGPDPSRRSRHSARMSASGGAGPAGRIRRFWEHTRGWPKSVPVDCDLHRRVAFERSRTSVAKDLHARLTKAGLISARGVVLWVLIVVLAPHSIQLFRMVFEATPLLVALWIALVIGFEVLAVRQMVRRFSGSAVRASLRREGVDCCARCGHLMGAGGLADTCPECGQSHEELPLGWGPDPIAGSNRIAADLPLGPRLTTANPPSPPSLDRSHP